MGARKRPRQAQGRRGDAREASWRQRHPSLFVQNVPATGRRQATQGPLSEDLSGVQPGLSRQQG